MPFPMKIQPIDSDVAEELALPESMRPVPKSRLKRLFERQFTSVLKSSAEKVPAAAVEPPPLLLSRDGSGEFEPSSVCLSKMVQNFIEDNNSEKQRCGRNRCNCFNGSGTESSDEEWESYGSGDFGGFRPSSSGEACEVLKSLVLCASVSERNLLADTAKIVEKNKNCKRKDDLCRKIVANGLVALGYDAAICKSRWEKSPSCPAGEYEYVDVIIKGERLLVDIDFRSEFEIARPTKTYKSILQTLPYFFVGKADRLQRIVLLVSEAAKRSLKKRGMHVPPWRKAEYVKAKWLSPHVRANQNLNSGESAAGTTKKHPLAAPAKFPGVDPAEETELEGSVLEFSDDSEDYVEVGVTSKFETGKPSEAKAQNMQFGASGLGLGLAVDP